MRSLLTAGSLLTAAILLALTPALASASPGDPLKTTAPVPIGVIDAEQWFVGIDEDTHGTTTRYTPVAYKAPKWRKARIRGAARYQIDTRDEETQARSEAAAERARQRTDEAFDKAGVKEADPIMGGFTGRFRILDLGLTIYMEEQKVLARVGDTSVIQTLEIVKDASRLVGRCKGTQESKILHAVARPDWNAVAVYVEATCQPDSPNHAFKRVRRLYTADISELTKQ